MKDFSALRKSGDFARVIRLGRQARNDNLRIHALAGENGGLRIGVVVTRKAGGAVVRNLIRRRILHIARNLAKEFVRPADLVIYINRNISNVVFRELEESARGMFEYLGLISK